MTKQTDNAADGQQNQSIVLLLEHATPKNNHRWKLGERQHTRGLVLHIFFCRKCSINCLAKLPSIFENSVHLWHSSTANHTQSFGVILETPPQTQSSKLDRARLLESVHRG